MWQIWWEKQCSWYLFYTRAILLPERRLDNRNYDSLTQLTKRKEEIENDLTILTKVGEDTKIDLDDVSITDTENIIDNDNNQSNNKSIYGNEERITSISKKPIYLSYKDACMNHGNHGITYGRHGDNATPPVISE